MNKLLNSFWFIAALGFLVTVATVAALYVAVYDPPPLKTERELELDLVDGAGAAALWNLRTGQLDRLAHELESEKLRLVQREEVVKKLEERVKAERLELERLQQSLLRIQEELTGNIVMIETGEVKKLRTEADRLANMEPDSVVMILDKMNEQDAVKVLHFMTTDTLSAVFESMLKTPNGPQRVVRYNELLRRSVPATASKNP